MLKIVVPMAGRGSRFVSAGYKTPKPLIDIHGVPMIRLVIENIRPKRDHQFVFIYQVEHAQQWDLKTRLMGWAPGAILVELSGVTEGAACTVMAAREHINGGDAVMIANSDQYIDIDINDYLADMDRRALDGLIMTMFADDPKWSFAAVDDVGLVTRVVEKEVISNYATTGIYNFRRGRDFVASAEQMINKNLRVNNEFYVAPVFNELVEHGARVGIYDVSATGTGMHGLGVPADLAAFLNLPLSRDVTRGLA